MTIQMFFRVWNSSHGLGTAAYWRSYFFSHPSSLSPRSYLYKKRDVRINIGINCHMVFIVEVRFLQKILVIRKRGKMRLNWLNWESQKRTTWKISCRTAEKHNPPCMLSRIVTLSYQPFIWWPSPALAHRNLIQGKQWKLKSPNSSDYNRYQYSSKSLLSLGSLTWCLLWKQEGEEIMINLDCQE